MLLSNLDAIASSRIGIETSSTLIRPVRHAAGLQLKFFVLLNKFTTGLSEGRHISTASSTFKLSRWNSRSGVVMVANRCGDASGSSFAAHFGERPSSTQMLSSFRSDTATWSLCVDSGSLPAGQFAYSFRLPVVGRRYMAVVISHCQHSRFASGARPRGVLGHRSSGGDDSEPARLESSATTITHIDKVEVSSSTCIL